MYDYICVVNGVFWKCFFHVLPFYMSLHKAANAGLKGSPSSKPVGAGESSYPSSTWPTTMGKYRQMPNQTLRNLQNNMFVSFSLTPMVLRVKLRRRATRHLPILRGCPCSTRKHSWSSPREASRTTYLKCQLEFTIENEDKPSQAFVVVQCVLFHLFWFKPYSCVSSLKLFTCCSDTASGSPRAKSSCGRQVGRVRNIHTYINTYIHTYVTLHDMTSHHIT